VERTEVFEFVRIRIDTVIETNWADGQLIAQARAYGVPHIAKANILRGRQKITGISEYGALEFAENREGVFNIPDGVKFSTDGMTVIILRTEIAFAETAHRCGAANEKTFVDRNGSRFVGTAVCERMNDADTRAKCNRGLAKETL
jgi:hypothetical protein